LPEAWTTASSNFTSVEERERRHDVARFCKQRRNMETGPELEPEQEALAKALAKAKQKRDLHVRGWDWYIKRTADARQSSRLTADIREYLQISISDPGRPVLCGDGKPGFPSGAARALVEHAESSSGVGISLRRVPGGAQLAGRFVSSSGHQAETLRPGISRVDFRAAFKGVRAGPRWYAPC
jgi:hypothetical protein